MADDGRDQAPRARALAVLAATGERRIAAGDVEQVYDTLLCAARAFGVGLQVLRDALDDVFAGAGPRAPASDVSYIIRELIRDGVAMTADVDLRSRRALAIVRAELDHLAAQMASVIGEDPAGELDDPYPLG
jgi:hypothetical protein